MSSVSAEVNSSYSIFDLTEFLIISSASLAIPAHFLMKPAAEHKVWQHDKMLHFTQHAAN